MDTQHAPQLLYLGNRDLGLGLRLICPQSLRLRPLLRRLGLIA
jgi:hypothetical protein